MNAHTPFDANQDWTNPYCQNSSNDPMVDALLGNAYHVVRTVYCNLGNLKLIYDFLNQYGMVLGVQSEAELKALTTKASFARIYDKTPAGDRQVTDYLYVEGDRTGILPDDTTATGSWVKVATSGTGGSGGESTNGGGYIPWIYNSGSANGGETTIRIPDETAGAPFMIVNGDWQTEGYDFEYDPVAFEIKFTTPLEQGDFVVVMRTGVPATPDNPNVSDWVTINWLYNQGAAVGGEQVIDIPYTFQSVPAVYKNGLRFHKGLTNNSYTIDSANNRIILTEPLATNDRLIVQLGGEAKVLEIADHTIQEVARAVNVKDSEVILSTDTTQVLNSKKVIFDEVTQHIYGLPTLPTNVYISSVSGGQLTYNPGSVTVPLVEVPNSAAKLKSELNANTGSSMVRTSSGITVEESLVKLKDSFQLVTPEQFYEQFPGETDWAVMINAAYAYARSHNKSVLLANDYPIESTIVHMDGLNVICTGRIIASPTGTYTHTTASGNEEKAAYVITTENGVFNNAKSSSIIGSLTITHTANRELVGNTDPHINATGVVITDIANVYISNIQTFGFLNGGIDVGGVSGKGYEIVIDKSLSWIYAWEDSDKIGFRCNVTDSTFKDVVTVAYGIGIHDVKGGGDVFINPHPWGYPVTSADSSQKYPNRQCKIPFLISGSGSTFIRPYADTVTKIDSSMGSSRANGGIGFFVEGWRNKIIAADALIHNEDINTNMALVYFKGESARNEIEFVNIINPSKLIVERASYDSSHQEALFTNLVRVPEYIAGNLSYLTGSVALTGSGITSTGTYSLHRDGEYIDILITINVSEVSSPTGPISVTLPRGLVCHYGPCVEPNQSSCFGGINGSNIGTVAVLNGSTVKFYYKLANGTRTEINAPGVTVGVLEFFIRGKISN